MRTILFLLRLSLCMGLTSSAVVSSWAGVTGSISGTITDSQGVALPNAKVQVLTPEGKPVKEVNSSETGTYEVFPVDFGDYTVSVQAAGFTPGRSVVHVTSGGNSQADLQLAQAGAGSGKEMVLEVKAKRRLIQNSAAVSNREISKEEIAKLPQGEDIHLPKLLATTTPGIIQGPFGQTFIRGNHANIQYQIDGVQLPDSPSNTFGEAFSPRNIDHMEVITGGIPAEYGERLAAVVNIITKSGPEAPSGEAQLNYGSYNTFSPFALFGGSNKDGNLRYFLSANYTRTDRGLDTPQPTSTTDQSQGGTDAVHDQANGNSQFAKIDWIADNSNKFSFILFNSYNFFQVPNYPSSFSPNDPFFSVPFVDQFGNKGQPLDGAGNPTTPVFAYLPPGTDDNQSERNAYGQIVWRHSFSDRAFLQVAPYYKYSYINVNNDLTNDLSSANLPIGAGGIAGSTPSSFSENRHVNNLGLKGDYSNRFDERNLFKAGFQTQYSNAAGVINATTQTQGSPAVTSSDANPVTSTFEALYLQDDFTIVKPLILNAGIRYDATQFNFTNPASGDFSTTDYLFQPRIGLNYLITDSTKVHVFYGKLFQPAPAENLRDTFVNLGQGNALAFYDIKAEKDDYYETGIAQQFGEHAAALNVYYKNATNMLDDAQLLNTSVAQPYNFSQGYAYGLEFSVHGKIDEDWSDFANYTYEIAKGQGVSGGLFTGVTPNPFYQFLDHVQLHTANAGVTYSKNNYWASALALFGGGLRTGPNNSLSLPSHFTADVTVGYRFTGQDWWSKASLSLDVLNVFNNVYPITIANGFNGSHYAAGRQFFVRLTKEL